MELQTDFETRIFSSVDEVGATAWDTLSAGAPFQSARWYRFGERVMSDCQPRYIILSQNGRAVARGTFWLVRKEPLPLPAGVRSIFHAILRHWPLLICRSPLSNSSGLVLPEPPLRDSALKAIADQAGKELRRLGGSFLVFDYLYPEQAEWAGWPSKFKQLQIPDPGTRLTIQWGNFENYLQSKSRIQRHYKCSSRDAAKLGIRITRQASFDGLPVGMELIHNVERKHDSAPNPWAGGMLAHMEMVESTWLTAHIENQLVGCFLMLADNGVQLFTLPGLAEDVPFAYFMLLYEAIQDAFEKKLTALRWGSGAYEIKRRLGFELEENNNLVFYGFNPLFHVIARLMRA
jgi:hypothetical protein